MNKIHSAESEHTRPSLLLSLVGNLRAAIAVALKLGRHISVRRRENKLRVCETLSLGDKRFLALVMVEQQKFLVGGAPNSVALLAKFPVETSRSRSTEEVHLL
jgi:flagellar biogenesis protein FliO